MNIVIKPPFHCDYGFNIHFDGFAFVNYNCTVLDTSPVHFGENIFIAPNVCIACAGHALHPDERLLFNTSKPIRIEKNVWLGTNTAVLPGVVIGEGCVIGAGSIVTKDESPADQTAFEAVLKDVHLWHGRRYPAVLYRRRKSLPRPTKNLRRRQNFQKTVFFYTVRRYIPHTIK